MSNINDFVVENGVLTKYTGSDSEAVIPDGVTEIGEYAFYMHPTIEKVYMENSVKAIGSHAFYSCKSLSYVQFSPTLISIGSDAFWGCKNLTDIQLPCTLTTIDSYAFSSCASLKEIIIPDSVASIGNHAFCLCKSLVKVKLPEHLRKIENGTFSGCESLQMITIPSAVTEIGEEAFVNCKLLPASFRIYNYIARDGMILNCADTWVPVVNNVAQGEIYSSMDDFRFIEENEHYYLGDSQNPYLVFCGHKKADNHEWCEITINPQTKYIDIFRSMSFPHAHCMMEFYNLISELTWLSDRFTILPIKHKQMCVNSFLKLYASGEKIGAGVVAAYKKYINSQRKKYYPTLQNEALMFYFMVEHNIIAKEFCADILEEIQKTGNAEMISTMLKYMEKHSVAIAKKEPSLDVEVKLTVAEAKKCWKFEEASSTRDADGRTVEWALGITGYRGQDTSITIPSTIGKEDVVSICENGISPKRYRISKTDAEILDNLVEIIVPPSVKRVENGAFAFCKKLARVVFMRDDVKLYEGVFANCPSLVEVVIPENAIYVGNAMLECDALAGKDGLYIVGDKLLSCTSKKKKSIKIPKSVRSVNLVAFDGCEKLEEIYFTENVKHIEGSTYPVRNVKIYAPSDSAADKFFKEKNITVHNI